MAPNDNDWWMDGVGGGGPGEGEKKIQREIDLNGSKIAVQVNSYFLIFVNFETMSMWICFESMEIILKWRHTFANPKHYHSATHAKRDNL